MTADTVTTEGFFSEMFQRFNNWRDDRRERKSFNNCELLIRTYGNTVWTHRQSVNGRLIRAIDLSGLIAVDESHRHLDAQATVDMMFQQVAAVETFLEHSKPAFLESALDVERILRRHLSYVTPGSVISDVEGAVRDLRRLDSPLRHSHVKLELPHRPKLIHHFLAGERSDEFFDRTGLALVGVFEGPVVETLQPLDKAQFELLAAGTANAATLFRQVGRTINDWHAPAGSESIYVQQIERMCDAVEGEIEEFKRAHPVTPGERRDPVEQEQLHRLERRYDELSSAQSQLERALMTMQYWKTREQLVLLAYAPITAAGRILYRSITNHIR